MKRISALILAGGESNRMKQPKAFLKFDKNRTFLEKITNAYIEAGIDDIILVINASSLNNENKIILSHLGKKIILINNKNPEKGRLFSIKLGLSTLNNSKGCFIQNIDNPFVNSELLIKMIPLVKINSYVSPTFNKRGGHPILISKSIYDTIIEINDVSATLRNKLERFNKVILPSNENVLININTINDYTKYFTED